MTISSIFRRARGLVVLPLAITATPALAAEITRQSLTMAAAGQRARELVEFVKPIFESGLQLCGAVLMCNVILLCVGLARRDLQGLVQGGSYLGQDRMGDILRRSAACVVCFTGPALIQALAVYVRDQGLVPLLVDSLRAARHLRPL
ncbi:hypothetical protein [Paucibacter soli]|uniref:hypothetical protein n=1 Tax=Paucibacter soli TaxID=3133433 RepID=UPI0030A081B1